MPFPVGFNLFYKIVIFDAENAGVSTNLLVKLANAAQSGRVEILYKLLDSSYDIHLLSHSVVWQTEKDVSYFLKYFV